MGKKARSRRDSGRQCAALPFKDVDGQTLVLLVTSRETRRWVLPKGWRERRLTGAALAAKEAFEEAGIRGEVAATPVGSYRYVKRLDGGREIACTVKVYPLRVTELLESWPEQKQRRREWFTFGQAALAVDEGDLATLLVQLATP
jgi:8-oxo-dGTP pyrophosphatase MutT (NUDIX family)